jgi:hypothetical protein
LRACQAGYNLAISSLAIFSPDNGRGGFTASVVECLEAAYTAPVAVFPFAGITQFKFEG